MAANRTREDVGSAAVGLADKPVALAAERHAYPVTAPPSATATTWCASASCLLPQRAHRPPVVASVLRHWREALMSS
jgi:hypothetical protein